MRRQPRRTPISAALCILVLAVCPLARAQSNSAPKAPPAKRPKGAASSGRVSLSPRFVAGQTFRYEMEYETTTETRRTGISADPQGPSSLVVDWNATVRVEVLPADASTPGGVRLRTTYEKSTASVRSDTFDPGANETVNQYQQLEGKVIEFTLDSAGKVKYVIGIEGTVESGKAAQSAREWIAQLSASAGAPPGGVAVGQTWFSEQPANTLAIAGLDWRTESEYVGNESCHPDNTPVPPPGQESSAAAAAPQDCAVILAKVSLVRSRTAHDQTPPELRKNGVVSTGKWTGAGQSLLYVSLASGFVVSATQTGTEQMDVLLTSNHNTSMRYYGTISSRSQVELLPGDAPEASDRAPTKP